MKSAITNTFEVNKIMYKIPNLDFNAVCELEDMGVSMSNLSKTPMSGLRGFFALSFDNNKDFAGAEIQEHMVNGGDIKNISEALVKAVENSGFFQALKANSKEKKEPLEIEAEIIPAKSLEIEAADPVPKQNQKLKLKR